MELQTLEINMEVTMEINMEVRLEGRYQTTSISSYNNHGHISKECLIPPQRYLINYAC